MAANWRVTDSSEDRQRETKKKETSKKEKQSEGGVFCWR